MHPFLKSLRTLFGLCGQNPDPESIRSTMRSVRYAGGSCRRDYDRHHPCQPQSVLVLGSSVKGRGRKKNSVKECDIVLKSVKVCGTNHVGVTAPASVRRALRVGWSIEQSPPTHALTHCPNLGRPRSAKVPFTIYCATEVVRRGIGVFVVAMALVVVWHSVEHDAQGRGSPTHPLTHSRSPPWPFCYGNSSSKKIVLPRACRSS
jgi:hypothetical protein